MSVELVGNLNLIKKLIVVSINDEHLKLSLKEPLIPKFLICSACYYDISDTFSENSQKFIEFSNPIFISFPIEEIIEQCFS